MKCPHLLCGAEMVEDRQFAMDNAIRDRDGNIYIVRRRFSDHLGHSLYDPPPTTDRVRPGEFCFRHDQPMPSPCEICRRGGLASWNRKVKNGTAMASVKKMVTRRG